METVTAKISKGNVVLLDGITAYVEVSPSAHGRKSWRGCFVLPQGTVVEAGGPYSFER